VKEERAGCYDHDIVGRITVFYTADLHEGLPQLAKAASVIRAERARLADRRVPTLYVDAGDSSDPLVPASDLSRGSANFAMLQAAGCDAATVGEGDAMRWGPQNVTRLSKEVSLPLMGSNLLDEQGAVWAGLSDPLILERDGLKVGLFGLTVPYPSVYALFGCWQAEPEQVVAERVGTLRERGAEVVVCVSHCGLPADIELLRKHRGVDLLVSSHTHDTPIVGTVNVGAALVVHPGAEAEAVGRIDLVRDGGRWRAENVQLLPPATVADEVVEAEWLRWERRAEELMAEPIGSASDRFPLSQESPCAVGALVCAALREWTGADAAVLFAGHLRDELPAGEICRRDVWSVVPGTASPGAAELDVQELRQMVQRALDLRHEPARAIQREHAGYLQSDRLRWELDEGTEQITAIYLDGQPLRDDARRLKIASTDLELGLARRFQLLDPATAERAEIDVRAVLREALERYLAGHSPAGPPYTGSGR